MRSQFQSGYHAQQGVLLLEVLVSLLIFSLAILGMVAALTTSMRTSTAVENKNRAALLANELAAIMQVNHTVSLPSATLTAWQNQLNSASSAGQTNSGLNGLPNASSTVAVSGTTNATITITWIEPKSKGTTNPVTDSYTTQVVVLP
ncbi:hypothetical protein [Andreprevotia chitinilytica]|uniref:hypothetical protein n=1 Tax=Andreprevotia chitinilytica TaxID=396808 RepID=UPI00068BF4E5|nr:hypothetical protein [Andreprevotia chitinilytica]